MAEGFFIKIEDKPVDVTSYWHPPAKEHSKPDVLSEIAIALVKPAGEAEKCLTAPPVKISIGASSAATTGTPRLKVAVIYVAESTTIESASREEN